MQDLTVMLYTYNRAELLKKCIGCILQSTYKDFKLTIIDNASTDNTREVVESFADKRIEYHNNGVNIGRKTIHRGLELCSTKYILWMCDDDFLYPTAIEKMMQVFRKNKDIHVVGVNYKFIDLDGNDVGRDGAFVETDVYYDKYEFLMQEKFMVNSTSILDMDFVRKHGIQYDKMNHDGFYTEKVALAGGKLYHIGEILAERTYAIDRGHIMDNNQRVHYECHFEHATECMEALKTITDPLLSKSKQSIIQYRQKQTFIRACDALFEEDFYEPELLFKDFEYRMKAKWIDYGDLAWDNRLAVYFKLFENIVPLNIKEFLKVNVDNNNKFIKSWNDLIENKSRLKDMLSKYDRIAIYGSLFHAKMIYELLKQIGVNVTVFFDSYAEDNKEIDGVLVSKPSDEKYEEVDAIIISSENPATIDRIVLSIIESNYNKELLLWDCII